PSANEKDLIKRVIGVGGDTVECKGGPVRASAAPAARATGRARTVRRMEGLLGSYGGLRMTVGG
ncbi:S26 family signal peptidase, partial [Streptomyces murinus]